LTTVVCDNLVRDTILSKGVSEEFGHCVCGDVMGSFYYGPFGVQVEKNDEVSGGASNIGPCMSIASFCHGPAGVVIGFIGGCGNGLRPLSETAQVSQLLIRCSMSLVIPGHKTESRQMALVRLIPKWLLWARSRTLFWSDFGMTA
jgi:hypothetical protein